ncbi:hypothetical protein VNO78_09999 [Psophocarpus tetragonolobus]|uniref:Uncharacterized protein n=1 Tax=Psophocarpus tetragonolobus TaxID=3891 RepID=A0AAN9SLH1_PSOTE
MRFHDQTRELGGKTTENETTGKTSPDWAPESVNNKATNHSCFNANNDGRMDVPTTAQSVEDYNQNRKVVSSINTATVHTDKLKARRSHELQDGGHVYKDNISMEKSYSTSTDLKKKDQPKTCDHVGYRKLMFVHVMMALEG